MSDTEPRYRVLIAFDSEKEAFVASVPELSGCVAEAETTEAALQAVTVEMEAQLHNMKESGTRAPLPFDADEDVSGELTFKISKSAHRELKWLCAIEELDEAQMAAEIFGSGLSHRLRQRPRRRHSGQPQSADGRNAAEGEDRQPMDNKGNMGNQGGGRRRRGKNRYHAIMDDRANFIEYVRGLEDGPPKGPGGPGGGGGRRRGGGGGGGGGRGRRR